MKTSYWKIIRLILVLLITLIGAHKTIELQDNQSDSSVLSVETVQSPAGEALSRLEIRGRAPKTGYEREQFGDGWGMIQGCDVRNFILARDLRNEEFEPNSCKVTTGILDDPYGGTPLPFIRGTETSDDIQIDHVVALSDAWQKGAQQLTPEQRIAFANDPLELLAVKGSLNQAKGDGDAATWLPPNKAYRCDYVARQIAIKLKYQLWVTRSEYDAIARILRTCPEQQLPTDAISS